jgi:class 3 adenylate cyclase
MLAELARRQQGERILLDGLTREEVGKFIQETTLVEPAAALVEKVYRQTEGNPFFVHEVVRLMALTGRIDEDASWSSGIPPNVREVIGLRFSRLSENCKHTLRTAAVLGREFDTRILERVADLPENTLFEVLDEARGARVIEEGEERLRFRFAHALIHQTLYEELNAPRCLRIHQRAGEALEQVHAHRPGPHLSEIARHYSRALEIVGATRVVDVAVKAGDRARDHHAYGEAADHYRVAVDALDRMDEGESLRLCELLVELARLQQLAGDREGEQETGRRAVSLARRLGAAELFARAALVYGTGAFVEPWQLDEGAVAVLEEALAGVGSEDSPLRARLLDRLARHLTVSPDPQPRQRFWEEARAIAARLEEPALLFDVSPALALWDRKLEDWLPASEQKVGLARTLGPGALFDALALRGTTRLQSGDVAGTLADHEEMEHLADELRTPYARYQTRLRRAMRATLLGELDDAERLVRDAFEVGKLAFGQTALQNFLAQQFVILIHRGTLRANRAGSEIADRFPDPVYRAIHARCLASEDSREQASKQFEQLAHDDFRDVTPGLNWGTTMCLLADVCDYLGDERRAALLYECLRPHASHFAVGGESGTGQIGPVGMRLGMLASLLRRFEESSRYFETTIHWARSNELRPWLAHTQFGYARMFFARDEPGDRQRALEQVDRALDLSGEVGMHGLVEDGLALKLAVQGQESGTLTNSIQKLASSVCERRPNLTPHAASDGSVTLMFSDIEDYTGMLVRLGDVRAHIIMGDHNALVRKQTAAHAGREVELRGDGFLLAFAIPEQAVRCAVALQRAFAAYNLEHPGLPIHIRIGLHTGEVIEDADKFFGSSVVKASRLADLARGREILVSADTRERVGDASGLDFDEGREVQLKGMRGTHRVHSVRWE